VAYVPDRGLVKCLNRGLQGIGQGDSVYEGEHAMEAKPSPTMSSYETNSCDPAAIEEACAKESSTHSGRDTTESSSQQIWLEKQCKHFRFLHIFLTVIQKISWLALLDLQQHVTGSKRFYEEKTTPRLTIRGLHYMYEYTRHSIVPPVRLKGQ
jgi:hypothetical protein